MSLDNELLKEFKSKDLINFSSYVIRLPFVYLSKILDELKQYLIIRPFHGVYTIYWKHKIFAEIIFEKYLSKKYITNILPIKIINSFLIFL